MSKYKKLSQAVYKRDYHILTGKSKIDC